jgi:hypothetical protein
MMGSMQCYPAKRSRRGFRRKCRTTSPHAWADPGPDPGPTPSAIRTAWPAADGTRVLPKIPPPCAPLAAKRRLSWRARFSAAIRTYLTSVPDPPGYKVSLFCRIEYVAIRIFVYCPADLP